LEDDPMLQNDKDLRMFCFIVKGDNRHRDQYRGDESRIGNRFKHWRGSWATPNGSIARSHS